ncbi:hypothetical protein [Robertkochia sediminum]|uniref:hypothetical protein n=1 Tax=Robertkochia sediminum TaxID=2785326 RepID=UPI001931794A|nr:hypothetical protein [Robertkochia sediminum]MBL7472219.1 hypothetical protein [Robertkochia sediminum]
MATDIKFFKAHNMEEKAKYVKAVYHLLKEAYATCGGINLANGFKDEDDMLKSIPVWRLTLKNDQLISVMLFKEKAGKLKMVAYAPLTEIDFSIRRSDLRFMLKHSYAELSGKLLSITLKEISTSWEDYVSKSPEKILKKELTPLQKDLISEKIPENSQGMYMKLKTEYPQLLEYCYFREIGGELKLKVLLQPKQNQYEENIQSGSISCPK